jgi:hypothetical protein
VQHPSRRRGAIRITEATRDQAFIDEVFRIVSEELARDPAVEGLASGDSIGRSVLLGPIGSAAFAPALS